MAKSKRKQAVKEPTQDQQQPYDNILKSLLEGHEKEALQYFLAGVVYLETLGLEVLRTILRVDRVYRVLYRGIEHILHLEFESGTDDDMDARLLDYHAYFYRKYKKRPVISIIIYPFRTKMAESPLREMSGDEELLVFKFRVFPLWELSAEHFVREHAVLMYALLPTMKGANAHLLDQAIDEMIEYFRSDEAKLAEEFRWLGVILRRADTVPLEDKHQIEGRLSMYDDLIERDPKMRKMREESEAKGKTEGKTEGLQEAVVTTIEVRFPPLTELAQQRVVRITKPDALKLLLRGINAAPDESAARLLLELLAA